MSVSAKTGYASPAASERHRRLFDFGMTGPGALATSVLVLFALISGHLTAGAQFSFSLGGADLIFD